MVPVYLNDIGETRGTIDDVVAQIPCIAGVYAWFRRIELPQPESHPDQFCEALRKACLSPHMPAFVAQVGPVHAVELSSSRGLGEATLSRLRTLCESSDFRLYVYRLLSAPHLFNSPLYVGKADDLRARVRTHLDGGSELLERLAAAGIDIRRCYLAWSPTPQLHSLQEDDANRIVEDLLSHLFTPPFTLRYG